MPHIALPEGLPGISSGFAYRPETAKPMRELAEVLLRGPHIVESGRARNDCHVRLDPQRLPVLSVPAIARRPLINLGGDYALVDAVRLDHAARRHISAKLKALLAIAVKGAAERHVGHCRRRRARAREQGATDGEIHDAVLIAAAFCMFNRYVDGLATWTPDRHLLRTTAWDGVSPAGIYRRRATAPATPR